MSNCKAEPEEPVLPERKTATHDTTPIPDPSLLHGVVGHGIVGPSRREEGSTSKSKRGRRSGNQPGGVCSLGAGRDKQPSPLTDLFSYQDIATEVMSRLRPDTMIRFATVSRNLSEQITADAFRSHVRLNAGRTGRLLGVFVKANKASEAESYRYLECCSLPEVYLKASLSIRQLWTSADTRQGWPYFEILDSRDGKLLVLAGISPATMQLYLCFPQARATRYMSIPQHALLRDPSVRLVTAAIVPEDSSHQCRIIILTRTGLADSKMKSEVPESESVVLSYSSASGQWEMNKAMFRMPGKHMLRLGSIFMDGTLHFLQATKREITVRVESLELGVMELPSIKQAPNVASKKAHVLCRGPASGLYLAVVSGRGIRVYIHTSAGWIFQRELAGPGKIEARPIIRIPPLRIIGSSTGLLFLKSYGEDILGMNIETGNFDFLLDEVVREEEALPYEQECPPVSQMLDRK